MKKQSYILDELQIIHDLLLHNFTFLQLFTRFLKNARKFFYQILKLCSTQVYSQVTVALEWALEGGGHLSLFKKNNYNQQVLSELWYSSYW